MKKLSYIMCLTLLFTTFGNVQKSSAFDWAKFQRTIDSYCDEYVKQYNVLFNSYKGQPYYTEGDAKGEARSGIADFMCDRGGASSSHAFVDSLGSFNKCIISTNRLCSKRLPR